MQISDSCALVTGAGGGLGEATARRLRAAGAYVLILDRNEESARRVANDLEGTPIVVDVSKSKDVDQEISDVVAEASAPLRIAVNCAGIGTASRILPRDGSSSVPEFEKTIAVNLIGTYSVLNAVAKIMAELEPVGPDDERGVIINTASVAWQDGQIGQAAYAASKGGIASLTLPAARELSRFGIRVAAIAPGLFETPLTAGLPNEIRAEITANIPFPQRLGDADEYAALVEHIVTNKMINGDVFRLDGAVRLPPK